MSRRLPARRWRSQSRTGGTQGQLHNLALPALRDRSASGLSASCPRHRAQPRLVSSSSRGLRLGRRRFLALRRALPCPSRPASRAVRRVVFANRKMPTCTDRPDDARAIPFLRVRQAPSLPRSRCCASGRLHRCPGHFLRVGKPPSLRRPLPARQADVSVKFRSSLAPLARAGWRLSQLFRVVVMTRRGQALASFSSLGGDFARTRRSSSPA
jgi:hypothetical protein